MGKCQDVYHEDEIGDELDYDTVIDVDGVRRCWGCVLDTEAADNMYLGEMADVA